MTLKEAKENYKIIPKHHYYEMDYFRETRLTGAQIKNTKVHSLFRNLAKSAYPTSIEQGDKRWFDFYFPVRRSGRFIIVPLSLIEYRRNFWIYFFPSGSFSVQKGKDPVDSIYLDVPEETLNFIPILKKTNNQILNKVLPYDLRGGKLKGKYLLKKCISKKEYRTIFRRYEQHIVKQDVIKKVSLQDYLAVCAICYRAAYSDKVINRTPLEMYKSFADNRHGGMLDIKNSTSRRQFANWLKGNKWAGAHPFEIVFSWHGHGIHLYPPKESSDKTYRYKLRVTNYAYASDFLKMTKALIERNIPFEAINFKNVLDFLAGETYFSVNRISEHSLNYIPCKEYKKKYFYKIEWEEPNTLRFK